MSSWRAIVQGDLADRIRERVEIIAREVQRSLDGDVARQMNLDDPWIPLLYAYLWADDRSRHDREDLALALIDEVNGRLDRGFSSPALWGGLAGIAWLNAHVEREFTSQEADPAAAEPPIESEADDQEDAGPVFDRLLTEIVRDGSPRDYDLISGLVGIGVLGLERLTTPTGADLVDAVTAELARRVTADSPPGATLLTTPDRLPPWQREIAPNGYCNLGVAHGVPGVVCFLAHAYAADRSKHEVGPLLDGLVEWIITCRDPGVSTGGGFAGWILPDAPTPQPGASRTAWCYGGLGVGAALVLAGRVTGNDVWLAEGMSICRAEAEVPIERSGVVDAGLCHGAAGNAHIFNRLFQSTGDERFRDVAVRYYGRTLDYADDSRGIGGYVAYDALPGSDEDRERPQLRAVADASFLTGATGVGLALLASVSAVEPGWDRVLCMNLPSRR